jgi:HEAT repeat protein
LDHELDAIVSRLIGGGSEEERGEAEGELLRQGERAMRVVMARFPGPVTCDRRMIARMPSPPRPSDCGVLLRLVARERKVALPFVLERLVDPDPEIRGWATYLLCDLPYAEALPQLFQRLRDSDPTTQVAAALAIASVSRATRVEARAAIREHARAAEGVDRAAAMRVMGMVRDSVLVPELVRALSDPEAMVVGAAHDALVQVTRQDFGTDARPWVRWWDHHATQHRIEWLIDALTHDEYEIRRDAAEELRGITREYFGYGADLPLRDRERAQQRYRDWWLTEGRGRFRRR